MLEIIKSIIDFVLHIDKHLVEIVADYHFWTYLILFVVLFAETGLVVTPFLPGDSLLFATGAVAALDGSPLKIYFIIPLLLLAVFSGDNSNYFIGKFIGEKVYEKDYKLIKKKYLNDTRDFYTKHGGITIIIARFMPIVRTFAPFVAGVGKMKYLKYIKYCIIGSILWVNLFLLAGYFFGQIPFVKQNFSIVVLAIIFISFMPPVIGFLKSKFKKKEVEANNIENEK